MAGHSKWANIKHRKGAQDKKRGALFTKIIKEITIAARMGGDDVNANPRLRSAVIKARGANMPMDNIERAIKKGSGNLEGVVYEEISYEGYGPGGIAIMVECLTDNKNRTTPEVRSAFNKNNGNLGENGCVAYMFDRKGFIVVEGGQTTEDDLMELLMEFDLEDVKEEEGNLLVTTSPDGYTDISKCIEDNGFNTLSNELTFIPQTLTSLEGKQAVQCLKLIEALEDLDDTQNVFSNYDISDEVMEKISEEL